MSEKRTDFENLISVPRLIFDEVSGKYGSGAASEKSLSKGGDIKVLRPLPIVSLGTNRGGKARACLIFESALHPDKKYELNRIELHSGMPESDAELEEIGTLFGPKALLTLRAGVRHDDRYKLLGSQEHRLSASAQFAFNDGFSFIYAEEYWPLMNEMLNRFYELTWNFAALFETKIESAA